METKEHAIAFAEWIRKSMYLKKGIAWCYDHYVVGDIFITTEELYDEYLKESKMVDGVSYEFKLK